MLEAVLISFVPAAAIVVVLVAVALVVSSLLFGDVGPTVRALRLALGSTVVALVICLPWVIGVLASGRGMLSGVRAPDPGLGGGLVGPAAPVRRRARSAARP